MGVINLNDDIDEDKMNHEPALLDSNDPQVEAVCVWSIPAKYCKAQVVNQ